MKLEKRWKNYSGDILVRESNKNGCGITEMLHLFDKKHDSGYTIGYWAKRKCDGEYVAEFKSVSSRIIEVDFEDYSIFFDALKFGQEIADLIIKMKNED